MELFANSFLLIFLFLNVGEAILDRPEGSECIVNGKKGKCINYQKCEALAVKLHSDYENTELELCSFDDDIPIVCCTGCGLSANITNMVFTYSGDMRWKTNQMSKEKCHTYSDSALESSRCIYNNMFWYASWYEEKQCDVLSWSVETAVGGQRARRNQFPHMALLGYGERLISANWLCGGSLISDRFILTAGHCTAHATLGDVKYVALGILRRSDPSQWWHRYEVKNILPHPDYSPPGIYNDIALLEMTTSVTFRPNVFPACLPYPNVEEEFGRQSVTATGWGAMGSHTLEGAETLQVIKVKEFSKEECEMKYKDKRHMKEGYNHTTQMCYGDHYKAVDTCKGDSGGPLQIHTNLCMYVVLGVTSSGLPCGTLGGAGLYTRVQHYLSWIESIVWADEVPDKTDIWRELILKKLEEKSIRTSLAPISSSSMRLDDAETSLGSDMTDLSTESDTEWTDIITITTESYKNINSTIEKPDHMYKDLYSTIKNQNDWMAFLNRHLQDSISKRTTAWIGTEIPDLESVTDKVSAASNRPHDDYVTIKPNTTNTDYKSGNSYNEESRYNNKTNNLVYDTERPIETEVSTEYNTFSNSATEKPENTSKDAYIKIKDQKDWIAFLNKHLIESVSKQTNKLNGTPISDIKSVSDKIPTSSFKPDDVYNTLKPDTTDSDSPDRTEADYEYSEYSGDEEFDYEDENKIFEKYVSRDINKKLETLLKKTYTVEPSTDSVKIPSRYADILTDAVEDPSKYAEISTDSVEIPTLSGEIVTGPIENSSTLEEPVQMCNSTGHSIRLKWSKKIELVILTLCSSLLRL